MSWMFIKKCIIKLVWCYFLVFRLILFKYVYRYHSDISNEGLNVSFMRLLPRSRNLVCLLAMTGKHREHSMLQITWGYRKICLFWYVTTHIKVVVLHEVINKSRFHIILTSISSIILIIPSWTYTSMGFTANLIHTNHMQHTKAIFNG